ncbi:MAG TPA: serine hydrolase domain-containing protein, partial [Myxococcota bacterium]
MHTFAILAALTLAAPASAVANPAFDGTWRGAVEVPGQPLAVTRIDLVADTKTALADVPALAALALAQDVPGIAVAVVRDGRVVYLQGFGLRDVDKKLPVTASTRFMIGSTTKAFTTALLGTLVDAGTIKWDARVRDLIPGFALEDEFASSRCTVRDLVNHRTGLPRHDMLWYGDKNATRADVTRRVRYLQPSADLREKFQYNNLGFVIAGNVVDEKAGMSWERALQERILAPLGMRETTAALADLRASSERATGYAVR